MLKKMTYLVLICLFSFFALNEVKAIESDYVSEDVNYSLASKPTKKEECKAIFGDPKDKTSFGYYLNQVLRLIQYLGPILCGVLTIVEFVKATASQDKELLSKAAKKTLTRVILAIILFFIPLITNFLFDNVLGWYGTCGIE